jgi:hypothetical protein
MSAAWLSVHLCCQLEAPINDAEELLADRHPVSRSFREHLELLKMLSNGSPARISTIIVV